MRWTISSPSAVARAVLLCTALHLIVPCAQAQLEPEPCKKLLWFTAISPDQHKHEWEYYLVALASARVHAPSLQPVFVWLGRPWVHTHWLESQGVHVMYHQLTFQAQMDIAQASHTVPDGWINTRGSYTVLDVAALTQQLAQVLDPSQVDLGHVLWTEPGVMFLDDVSSCTVMGAGPEQRPKPGFIAIGPEAFPGQAANTAVTYLRVDSMAAEAPAVVEEAQQAGWMTEAWVQGLLKQHFAGRTDLLGDDLNWKVYWGAGPGARVLYFHGPRPGDSCYHCFAEQRDVQAVYANATCACPPGYEGVFQMSLSSDGGRYFGEVQAAWAQLAATAREGFQAWQQAREVQLAARSHVRYLGVVRRRVRTVVAAQESAAAASRRIL